MKRTLLGGLAGLSCVALLAAVVEARAMMIAPAPVATRVATADVIVVGKVTGFADKMEKGEQFPGNKQEYQVAIVKVQDAVKGGKVKEIRVGFIPPAAGPGGGPGRPIRPGIRRAAVNLALNQEYCLFLSKPVKGDFYVAPMYFDAINKTAPNFANEVEEAKRCVKLLANPKAGLQSKKKDDRYLTAAMLLTRYRTAKPAAPGQPPKEVPIDAEQSKLILKALADADWTNKPGMFQMNPQAIFYRLGLTPKDGWTPPRDFKQFPEAAKKWLNDNAGKYRIKRFVAAK